MAVRDAMEEADQRRDDHSALAKLAFLSMCRKRSPILRLFPVLMAPVRQ